MIMDYVPMVSALVAAVGAITTLVTFWLNRGKVEQKAENAESIAVAANAKADLIGNHLADYKAEVARSYVTISSIDKVEQRLTTEVHRLSDELGRRMDELTRTLVGALSSRPTKHSTTR
jgi:hypothetical protein